MEGDHEDHEDDRAHDHWNPVVHELDGSLDGGGLGDPLEIILALEARAGHDPAEHGGAEAETQLLRGRGAGVAHADGVDAGLQRAVGDGVSHQAHGHGAGDAQAAALQRAQALGDEAQTALSLEASQALGVKYICGSVSSNGTFGCAAKMGVPGFLAEIGNLGLWSEEEVEQYDTLLSLAVTGGDYNWI